MSEQYGDADPRLNLVPTPLLGWQCLKKNIQQGVSIIRVENMTVCQLVWRTRSLNLLAFMVVTFFRQLCLHPSPPYALSILELFIYWRNFDQHSEASGKILEDAQAFAHHAQAIGACNPFVPSASFAKPVGARPETIGHCFHMQILHRKA